MISSVPVACRAHYFQNEQILIFSGVSQSLCHCPLTLLNKLMLYSPSRANIIRSTGIIILNNEEMSAIE